MTFLGFLWFLGIGFMIYIFISGIIEFQNQKMLFASIDKDKLTAPELAKNNYYMDKIFAKSEKLNKNELIDLKTLVK